MNEEQQQAEQTEDMQIVETEPPESAETSISEETAPTREMTEFVTDDGTIQVIHEITLGDLLITSFLFGIMILLLISQVIKRG